MKVHAVEHPHNGGNVPIDRFDLLALCEALDAQWVLIQALTDKVEELEGKLQDARWEAMGDDL